MSDYTRKLERILTSEQYQAKKRELKRDMERMKKSKTATGAMVPGSRKP